MITKKIYRIISLLFFVGLGVNGYSLPADLTEEGFGVFRKKVESSYFKEATFVFCVVNKSASTEIISTFISIPLKQIGDQPIIVNHDTGFSLSVSINDKDMPEFLHVIYKLKDDESLMGYYKSERPRIIEAQGQYSKIYLRKINVVYCVFIGIEGPSKQLKP